MLRWESLQWISKGNIIEVNANMLEILGSPSEELTRKINLFTSPPLVEAGIYPWISKHVLQMGKK